MVIMIQLILTELLNYEAEEVAGFTDGNHSNRMVVVLIIKTDRTCLY